MAVKQLFDSKLLLSLVQKYSLTDLFEKEMSSLMALYSFTKDETISKASDILDSLYFLVSGKIGIYKVMENGKALLLRFNQPLSVIGDLEFLNKYPVKTNVKAEKDALLIGIKFKDLYQHAYNDPKFLRFVIQNLSHKLYTFSITSSINLLCPLENRFASYLFSVNPDPGVGSLKEEIKVEKVTELAMLLGTSYRHLLRVIQKFVTNRIIDYDRGVITVLDHNKLRGLARENIYE